VAPNPAVAARAGCLEFTDNDIDYHNSDGSIMPDVLAKGREACTWVSTLWSTSLQSVLCPARFYEFHAFSLLQLVELVNLQVKHFKQQYCTKKRVQRLLDGNEDHQGPISLPQLYTFKQLVALL
jgi:cytochrome c oxidase assembly factor 6